MPVKKKTTKKTTVRKETKTCEKCACETKTMVGFGQAVCNFWTHYFDFFGRATRSEFWFGVLFVLLANFLVVFFVGNATLFLICYLLFFIPSISLMTRRFRDAGLNGWIFLLGCFTFYAWPALRGAAWQRWAVLYYRPLDLSLYYLFSIGLILFCLVVACLPTKRK